MPFNRFRTADGAWVDTLLGPEMKSTGEVMGLDVTFGVAFAKSQTASYGDVPTQGSVFVSVANRDKRHAIFPVKRLADLGFRVYATEGTAQVLRRNDVEVTVLRKETQGPGADGTKTVVQAIMDGEISLIFNTPLGVSEGGDPRRDGWQIRSAAILCDVPCVTTVAGLSAAVQGIEALRRGGLTVRPLQAWSADMRRELAAAPASSAQG
jgi:carbamoyl-phosphate synthase large subunit